MSVVNAIPLIAAGDDGYNLTRSLRFRGAYPTAPSYLSRTAGTPTNNLKWTYSLWVKRGVLGVGQFLLNGGTGTSASEDYFAFFGSDKISFGQANASSTYLLTASVYRDPAAWYHIVFVYDSAQATASNRALFYVNGVQVTSFSNATYPTLNQSTNINASGVLQRISSRTYAADEGFDGYIAEINFIDGQALTPSSLGEFNIYNVWKPKKYVGTYGNNGFYLPFTNNASTTTLGYDFSGNGNNWTTTKISVTAGSTYDSMTDVPTLTSATAANYAVLNPLTPPVNGSLSNGNLLFTGATDWGGSKSTFAIPTTGKWYAEFTIGSTTSNSAQADMGIFPAGNSNGYAWSGSYGLEINSGFFLVANGSYSTDRGGTTAGGTVLQIAVNADAGNVWFGVANAWYNTYNTTNGNPSAGTNPSGSGINFSAITYFMGVKTDLNNWAANFGQRPFAYTPPTGYLALNTFNL